MWTGIEFLHFLEDVRDQLPDIFTAFLNAICSPIMQMAVPVALVAVLFWLSDRERSEQVMFGFGLSMIVTDFVKDIVKQPRPWVLDPSLDPDPHQAGGAKSWSLPSGHTASALSAFGLVAWLYRNRVLRVLLLLLAVIIPFARMYLGVHTPLDLICAGAIVVAVVYVNSKVLPWSHGDEKRRMQVLACYLIVVIAIQIATGLCNGKIYGNKMVGLCAGIFVGLMIEERFIHYRAPRRISSKIVVTALLGLTVVGIAVAGLRALYGNPGLVVGGFVQMMYITVVHPWLMKRYFGEGSDTKESRPYGRTHAAERGS